MKNRLIQLLCSAWCASILASPNIIYIIPDDHTYRDFGFMGSGDAVTPHLDRLAERSARFINGYVPSSLCSPSLAVLLTGLYPHQSGLYYNHPPPGNSGFNRMKTLEEYEKARSPAFEIIRHLPTLPRALSASGWLSFQTGKYWEGHFSNAGFDDGMTIFKPRPGQDYGGNRTLRSGVLAAHGNGDHGLQIGRETMQPIADFIDRSLTETKPFFVWYAPYLPHTPHDSPQRYHEIHQARGAAAHRIPYLAAISQLDDTVGEILDMLDKRGLTQKTLIVLCSDNGWSPSTVPNPANAAEYEGTKESKYSPFEDGLRTPILVSLPGTVKPATHEQLVSSVDLLPTVLEAAGLGDAVPNLPGRSLWQVATGAVSLAQQPVYGEIYPGDAESMRKPAQNIAYRWMRDGDYKLIIPHSRAGGLAWKNFIKEPALFDLKTDPQEKHNLALERPDVVNSLRKKLDAWWTPK
jgi:arylsulfatase A